MCEVHVANIWKHYWKIMKCIKYFLNWIVDTKWNLLEIFKYFSKTFPNNHFHPHLFRLYWNVYLFHFLKENLNVELHFFDLCISFTKCSYILLGKTRITTPVIHIQLLWMPAPGTQVVWSRNKQHQKTFPCNGILDNLLNFSKSAL